MKKIIMSAAVAAFAFVAVPAMADTLPVKVVKTKIPEGCEYKKVPGKKQKQLICEEDTTGTGGGSSPEASEQDAGGSVPQDGTINDGRNGKGQGMADKQFRANNGGGNGTTDGTPGKPQKNLDPAP